MTTRLYRVGLLYLSSINGDVLIAGSEADDISPVITECFGNNLLVAYTEYKD
jgi:hypothetical protein